MRPNEFYIADIDIDGALQRPSFLGSFDNLAAWAHELYQEHQAHALKISAKKVVHTGAGITHVEIPKLTPSEIIEAQQLAEQGNGAMAWLFTTLNLLPHE
ncbi:MAG: hypothetical protein V1487_03260 [bacterium]